MSLAAKTVLSLTGLALVGGGVLLWAEFGRLVYFDVIAASFVGCFL